MAEVLVLAENINASDNYVGDAIPVTAGTPITVHAVSTGSTGFPTSPRLEGSLDGSLWVTIISGSLSFNNLTTIVANGLSASNHMFNYIRYAHGAATVGSNVTITKVSAIQGDSPVADVNLSVGPCS